jgi:hypothetical protein
MSKKLMVFYRVVVGFVVLAAVIAQLRHGMQSSTFSVANFFSFFTIESNIFGAIVLLASVFIRSKKLDYLRGAATLYMAITGVIYIILLSGADVQTPLPGVNIVLHYAFPVAMLLDWVVYKPQQKISFKKSLAWLIFPIAYAVYSLVRGHFAHWYPYPFIDVDKLGYWQVFLNCLIIAPGILALDFLVTFASRSNRKKLH